jgi:competence protein ComEA
VVRSFLVKLAMLSATLSMVVWMGWTASPDHGEAGPVEPPAELDLQDASPPPIVALDAVPQPTPPVTQPMSVTPPTLLRDPTTVKAQLDLNQATLHEFDQLPGIGPALAQRIVEHRRSHGRFTTVDDLLLVKGIGPKTLERFRDLVTVRNETGRAEQRGHL